MDLPLKQEAPLGSSTPIQAATASAASNYKTRSTTKRSAASILDTSRASIGSMHSTHSQYLNSTVNREIREGREYQVPVENLAEWEKKFETGSDVEGEVTEVKEAENEEEDKDVCLWRPERERMEDRALMAFCTRANELYGIGGLGFSEVLNFFFKILKLHIAGPDRALLILYHSGYDLSVAERKLQTRRPQTPLAFFTDDDQYIFRNAIVKYGKSFAKIHQMIPHKSVPALVQYYYDTKKCQHYKSHLETSALTGPSGVGGSGGGGVGKVKWEEWRAESESEEEELSPPEPLHASRAGGLKREGFVCENCRHIVKKLYNVNELEVCTTCKLYFRATNQHRQCPPTEGGGEEGVRRPRILCPPDMQQIAEQFVEFAQPVESTAAFEDADDTGELQIEMPTITRCQLEISECDLLILKSESFKYLYDCMDWRFQAERSRKWRGPNRRPSS